MNKRDILHILWTSGDMYTAQFMVLLYARNAMTRGWWKKVNIIVWGAATKLVAECADVQRAVMDARNAGIQFSACLGCAQRLGLAKSLEDLGIEVEYWGEELTELIRNKENIIFV